MEQPENEKIKNGLLSSLDLEDEGILPHIAYLLKDLWEMGSAPAYKYELLNKCMLTKDKPSIIDLGCGKGAELIQLADKFEFNGTGVDIVPEFIEEANFRKSLNHCEHIEFIEDDFVENFANYKGFDILIFNYDEDFFGNVTDSLNKLRHIVKENNGYILFDTISVKFGKNPETKKNYLTYKDLKSQIETAHFEKAGYIYWDRHYLSRTNSFNTNCIQRRADELAEQYPDKKELFYNYLDAQKRESALLENDLDCITWLLKSK